MDRLPTWADLGAALYGFPDDGESGFKVAWHEPRGTAGHEGPPGEAELEALREAAAARFPALRGATVRGAYLCAYDATADEMFQIGEVPGVERLYFAGGLSGHGYKHAPSLGESLAALVAGERPLLDLAPYRLRA
jgi:glycine/D-amino acid oxidase-like deaminating enzyme